MKPIKTGFRASPVAIKNKPYTDMESNHTDSNYWSIWCMSRWEKNRLPFMSRCKGIEYYFGCKRCLFIREAESKWCQCITAFSCYLILLWDPLEREYILAKLFTIQQYHVSRMSRFFHPTTADALSGLGVGTWKSQKGSILIKKCSSGTPSVPIKVPY